MVGKEHPNAFVDVHNKIRAFKDRLREANKDRSELRKDKLEQETQELLIADAAARPIV